MQALDIVERVRAACLDGDGVDPLDEAAGLALRHHGVPASGFAAEDDGFALVRDGELTLAVAPAARRHGVGARLLAQVADASPDHAWSHGDHPAAARLADRAGWRRARELWVMRRPRDAAPLPALEVSEDVIVRAFDPDSPADADAVLAVNAAAFAHHPEQGSLDRDGLAERMAEPWFDAAGLLLAVDSNDTEQPGRLRAFHWTKRHSATLGEVYVVGVDPNAQGRGLGRLVTLAGLHHLASTGVEEVLLYVESDNAAAVHTYSALGFTHAASDTHVQYRR